MTSDRAKADRILEAAQSVLASEGFAGTTVAKVAREAGVSRGLLHYYFASKEDMLAQMLRRSAEESRGMVRALMARSASAEELADNIVEAMREYARTHQGSLSLLAEGLAVARNHPHIREVMSALHREGQQTFTDAFEVLRREGRVETTIPARGLATILIALLDGLGLELHTVSGLAEDEETWAALRESVRRLIT